MEKIRRQAHQVRGHIRRLNPRWRRSPAAIQKAQRFNFVIPEGYTFVQPYQTGVRDISRMSLEKRELWPAAWPA